MNYNCEICNFQTEKQGTWYSHLKSKKHNKNKQEIEVNKANYNGNDIEKDE